MVAKHGQGLAQIKPRGCVPGFFLFIHALRISFLAQLAVFPSKSEVSHEKNGTLKYCTVAK